ncbi:hypothetical protein NUW58_g2787 [Xylaria curta]|uniref:Uncharacterized protein n=1 Tax=Xylaria curta TaxID=42375 RepID=A0ACC1PGB1_9PEZI|nr:hypothetical protein NUW58_g2787 [Xylaria curta]
MAQEQTVLPKGIVLNRNAIYEEIAKNDIIPVDQILRACHVFSTTSRELYDPTARRLENFWTRVLGGDRRYLSGRVIARLFKDISEETSFVKLRGPHNRYEPPSPRLPTSKSHDVQAISLMSAAKPTAKPIAPAKPPHPILKKPRGPSASGPRPTARFVSPPGSDIELDDINPSGATTPISTATHGASSRGPGSPGGLDGSTTNGERKKGGSLHKSKKKTMVFVASTSSKRRPGMPRRASSQSSGGASDLGPKEGDSSLGSKHDGSQSSVPTILEKPEQQPSAEMRGKGNADLGAKAAGKQPITQSGEEKTASKSGTARGSQIQNEVLAEQEDTSRRQNVIETKGKGSTALSAKAAGKQPMTRSGVERTALKSRTVQRNRTQNEAVAEREDSVRQNPAQLLIGGNNTGTRLEMPSSTIVQRKDLEDRLNSESPPPVTWSSSEINSVRPASREVSRSLVPPSSLTSSTPARLDTSVIGQGTMSEERPPPQGHSISSWTGPIPRDEYRRRGLMDPTPPNPASIIPLGRSRSHLTVLLDQTADKKPKRR